jgi:hypothetical protein
MYTFLKGSSNPRKSPKVIQPPGKPDKILSSQDKQLFF